MTSSVRQPSAVSFCESIVIEPLPSPSTALDATTPTWPAAPPLSKEITSPGSGGIPAVPLPIFTSCPPAAVV